MLQNQIFTGYETGEFLGYVNADTAHYYYYRNETANSACDAIPGYPAYSVGCAQMFSINADGTPVTPVYQTSFDPTTRIWYTTARNAGTAVWSGLYASVFQSVKLQGFSIPLYYPVTGVMFGVTATSVNLQKCKCKSLLKSMSFDFVFYLQILIY